MKINNKGFAISSIMYLILVMALIIVAILLSLLSNRKVILDKQKKIIVDKYAEKEVNYHHYDVSDYFSAQKSGLFKFKICGARAGNVNGSCVSGLKELNRGDGLSITISNSTSISSSGTIIMFAAAGSDTYINNDCGGSYILGDKDCPPPVLINFVFSNTEINKKTNTTSAYAEITYIGS